MNSIHSIYKLINEKEDEISNRKFEEIWNNVWIGKDKMAYRNCRSLKTADKIRILSKMGVDFREKSILDIGCGNGEALINLHKLFDIRKGLGVDISSEAINKLKSEKKYRGIDFIVGDHRNLENVRSCDFDIVLSWGAMEHFEDYLSALSEARRVLKKGGMLILIQPHLFSFGAIQKKYLQLIGKWRFGYQLDFSYLYYRKILRNFGFKQITCFTMPPYPDMKITRILDRFVKKFIFKKWGHYLYITAKK